MRYLKSILIQMLIYISVRTKFVNFSLHFFTFPTILKAFCSWWLQKEPSNLNSRISHMNLKNKFSMCLPNAWNWSSKCLKKRQNVLTFFLSYQFSLQFNYYDSKFLLSVLLNLRLNWTIHVFHLSNIFRIIIYKLLDLRRLFCAIVCLFLSDCDLLHFHAI